MDQRNVTLTYFKYFHKIQEIRVSYVAFLE